MSDHQSVGLSPDEVRAALDCVLASEPFANAGRLSRLLRYLVERTLAGEADQIKEYVLGVEVFDRGDHYDPRLDSIVRVEARRLRAKLNDYYAGPGAADALVITMPLGSYVPRFQRARAGPKVQLRNVALMGVLTAAVVVMLVAIAWRSGASNSTAPAVVVAVLPFESYLTAPEDARVASQLTDSVTAELAKIGSVGVVSRTSARQFEGARRPMREIAQALNAQVVMEGTITEEAGRLRVQIRLVDATLDRKMWVDEFFTTRAALTQASREIAVKSAEAAVTKRPRPVE